MYSTYNFFENGIFIADFIYSDLIMILVGYATKNSPTSDQAEDPVNWYYYMSYYTGDLLFRFIFMAETEDAGNCWYPWVECETVTTVELSS